MNEELITRLKSLGFGFTRIGESLDHEANLAKMSFTQEELKKVNSLIDIRR